MKNVRAAIVLATALVLVATAYSAYKGHANDADVNAVLSAYPALKNTAVDSCATCHKSGEVPDSMKQGRMRHESYCGYCHTVYVRNKRDIKDTLNRYGADYLAAGRGVGAVRALAGKDSDGDGFSNEAEFVKGTNPGDPACDPSAAIAPATVYSAADLRKLSPVVSATVFLNTSHNQAGDFYNRYRGNELYALLRAAGISDKAESVDFISLDGFENAFSMEELKKIWPQGAPFLGLGKTESNPCGWVNYSVAGLDAKKVLPSMRVLLAFEENGKKIEAATMDAVTGKIKGTGPLRLVVPQFQISPPDLSEYADKSCRDKVAPEFRFNSSYDHNGGRSSFSIIAIRVNPLPKGTRDFEWEKVRDEFVAQEKLVIFGAIK
ncbi:MAG TPA: GEGP motif-containing diheme protein [Acidobacteriota bacterium]|nr:GEGP motif-containing diheme protein [Acidobacteriota bacterium]